MEPIRERFGRYELIEKIGGGGMGDVYRALAPGALGVTKELCIKRIRPELSRERAVIEMFATEARVSMLLSHGNIVQVFDFGRVGDELFLAMELVDGLDLRSLLDRLQAEGARLLPPLCAHVGVCVCTALAYAHERRGGDGQPLGIVHRDLSPGNVIVARSGEIKLADFGVAHLAEAGAGRLRGTIAYMAPEQAAMLPVDGRADQFGLGLLLYEMLSGRSPYAAGTRDEILQRAKNAEIPPLPAEVPEALRNVVVQALEFDPRKRFLDARAMRQALAPLAAEAGAPRPEDELTRLVDRLAPRRSRSAPPAPARPPGDAADAVETIDTPPATYYTVHGQEPNFAARLGQPTRPALPIRPAARWAAVLGIAALGAAAFALFTALSGPDGSESTAARARAVTPPVPGPSPQFGTGTYELTVDSTPRESAVYVDDAWAGTAPVTLRLDRSRSTNVEVRRPGFEPWRRAVNAGTGASVRAILSLNEGVAVLNLNALPWGEVEVDGEAKGTTPLLGVRVRAGRHRVRFFNPVSGAARIASISVAAGEERQVVVDLAPSEDPIPPRPR